MAELFDDISRIVGSGVPRRQMLRLMAVAFAGGALPALRPARVAAFEICNQTWNAGSRWELLQNVNCVGKTHDEMINECNPHYFGILDQLLRDNAGRCPTTCPPFVDSYDTDAECIQPYGEPQCEVNNVILRCHCNPPPGQTCCGLHVFCTPSTQKCCGTYCAPLNQTCSSNPSNPR
jgi:hypothetical protein